MKNVIYLLMKYGAHFLFLLLEVLCFYLVINYNQTQKEIFLNSTNVVVTKLNSRVDRFQEYLRLEKVNDSLQVQNGILIKKFINSELLNLSQKDSMFLDSTKYELISVKLCNSTFNLKNNYVTLCEGSMKGIGPNMGVISENGLVGQVVKVSENYSKVMSILHNKSRISAAIKRNKAYGNLRWNGDSPLEMILEAIPKHIDIRLGDTIITSGFSTIFPKGIEIGVITEYNKGNNDFIIRVKLFNDPTKWDVMYVILNKESIEQLELEESEDI